MQTFFVVNQSDQLFNHVINFEGHKYFSKLRGNKKCLLPGRLTHCDTVILSWMQASGGGEQKYDSG